MAITFKVTRTNVAKESAHGSIFLNARFPRLAQTGSLAKISLIELLAGREGIHTLIHRHEMKRADRIKGKNGTRKSQNKLQ